MARWEAIGSPGRRRNSHSQLLQELESISQSLYHSQHQSTAPKTGGSLSLPSVREHSRSKFTDDLTEKGIPLAGLAHARQGALMANRNIRHSIASQRVEEVSSTAGMKARFSTSTASPSGVITEKVEIKGRRRRNSLSPFRWRRHEEIPEEKSWWADHDEGVDGDLNRKMEESAEKSKGFWTWRPLRALSHIGMHRISCVFSVYVNAIEGLSTSMNGLRLAVNLRKRETKEGAVQTMPSRVFEGSAEFEETLHIRCHVYGGKHGPQGTKFQSRPFSISVVAVDAEELDLGKHHLDLGMLLHDAERMQAAGEECNGWNANFDLWGKAKGAKLLVGLGYEILDKDHGNHIGTTSARYNDSASKGRRISKSTPSSARGTPRSVPAGFSYANPGSSSPFMVMDHLNLDDDAEALSFQREHKDWVPARFREGDSSSADVFNSISHESQQGLNMAPAQPDMSVSKETGDNDEEEDDFEVVEKGVEIQEPVKEENEKPAATAMESVEQSEKIDKEEEESEKIDEEEEEVGGEIVKEVVQEEDQQQQHKRFSELDSIVQQINALESVILDKNSSGLSAEESQDPNMEPKEMKKDLDGKNVLWDEEVELVAEEFLHTLEEEIQDGREMELDSLLEAAESEMQKWENKSRAALIEDEEAEALMHEWGLNEEIFQSSSPKSEKSVFSSRRLKLPDLGGGLGSVVQTRDGGMLASMDPGHFRKGGRLVMQVSKPVVVPAEMGDGPVEILQTMAGMGTAAMAEEAMACMPFDDLAGKTVEQIAFEGMASAISKHSEQKGIGRKPTASGLQTVENMNDEYVSLESVAPLAIQKIEAMAMEGLKIQADLTEEEAPYSLPPIPLPKHGTVSQLLADAADNKQTTSKTLMSMAISLDEWTRLDAGIHPQEETKSPKTKAILAAHHAHGHKSKDHGHMGNSLTLVLLVQLRDPLRNHEAVGSPMIALVQAERLKISVDSLMAKTVPMNAHNLDEEDQEDSNKFKIKGVHLSGLRLQRSDGKKSLWGSEKQYQTGSRWLLANGMTKNPKHALLKSKLQQQPQIKAKQGEFIWSMSASTLDTVGSQKAKGTIRNPDVVFTKRTMWRG